VHELYTKADPHYTGRVSVPVLWDKKTGTIVSNESSEIIRMFNGAFAAFTDERTDYYPTALRSEIDALLCSTLSSMSTSRAGSNVPCFRIQRRRVMARPRSRNYD
jgi:glutathionyl-hydroquinone reductase